jgi:F0F1-type ATP synthase membrane subunit c/vacuolar-type H+-ATPase subunit K/polyhydroxyalkanoate synthesis regulator phasin
MAEYKLGDGIKKFFLAGVGAAAITVEKGQEIIGELVKKGELTVEQGKEMSKDLQSSFKQNMDKRGINIDELSQKISKMSEEELAKIKDQLAAAEKMVSEKLGVAEEEAAEAAEAVTEEAKEAAAEVAEDVEVAAEEAAQTEEAADAAAAAGLSVGMGYLSAALAVGLGSIGCGIALANAAPAAIGAVSEEPSSFGKALIFVALGEGVALYGFLIAFMIINKL